MTSGFEETKSVGKYSIVQRKSWGQRKSWNELVYKQRELKDFLKKPNINTSTQQ